MNTIYLMHSTTVPLDPRVREAMLPLLEEDPRRPEGLLASGRRPRGIIEQAREAVARLCGGRAEEIVFTSSGTEACNLALKGVALARAVQAGPGGRILVAATEHTAVLHPARTLGKLGFEIVVIPVDHEGLIDLDALEEALADGALIVSAALATAETGTTQPIAAIAALAHERGALLHTDACLAAAGLPLDVTAIDVDLASLSAHKLGGPRGAGALWIRDGVRLLPLIEGGVAEGGRRGGAEHVAGIAGFGAAAEFQVRELPVEAGRLGPLAARLAGRLARVSGVRLNGHPIKRLPGMVNISVDGVDGEALLLKLAARGIAASSGSPCFDEAGLPSHVLTAMGIPSDGARGSVLFSLGRLTNDEEIDRVIETFPEVVESLRSIAVNPGA
ncbi:MAG TPA: cysteine desulfurase family protein [Candidatus Polarisedimenticolia bacterium]|jgi:cysteine desulfurase